MAIGLPEQIDKGCLNQYNTSLEKKFLKKMRNKRIRIASRNINVEHPIVKQAFGSTV